jgi:beta-RFAP synthase
MFSFGRADYPQFGGVGVMVEPPAIELTIKPAEFFHVLGSLGERAEHFATRAARAWRLPALPRCEIAVVAPPDHTGLGVGTQLGLSVAAGLRRFLNFTEMPPNELATSVGRGARSAVGTYGFRFGGLIVDAGKQQADSLGELTCRAEMPDAWRFVLVRRANSQGLAGVRETDAFAALPPVPGEVTHELWRITDDEMLPAIDRQKCDAFGDAVYRFGRLAGECFAAVQRGPFANSETARLVEAIRNYGVPGVGQSSWGPTVFAVVPSEQDAQSLTEWLRYNFQLTSRELSIAEPNNRGASIEAI